MARAEIPAKVKEQLLGFLRGGEYAHPGEEEAIPMIFEGVELDAERQVLDAGCGLGGTADFIRRSGYGAVTGIDIDAGVIAHATETYTDCVYHCSSAADVEGVFAKGQFGLVCMINSFFYFPDQLAALKALRAVAKDDAALVISEYSDLTAGKERLLLNGDEGESTFHPINPGTVAVMLAEAGWADVTVESHSEHYVRWYAELCAKIDTQREAIVKQFGEDAFHWAHAIYNGILHDLNDSKMGGCVVRAKAMSVKLLASASRLGAEPRAVDDSEPSGDGSVLRMAPA